MSDASKLESLLAEIPGGTPWISGNFLRRLVAALIADRAVLAPGSGNEFPTEKGRVFFPEGTSVVVTGALNGLPYSGVALYRSSPTEVE